MKHSRGSLASLRNFLYISATPRNTLPVPQVFDQTWGTYLVSYLISLTQMTQMSRSYKGLLSFMSVCATCCVHVFFVEILEPFACQCWVAAASRPRNTHKPVFSRRCKRLGLRSRYASMTIRAYRLLFIPDLKCVNLTKPTYVPYICHVSCSLSMFLHKIERFDRIAPRRGHSCFACTGIHSLPPSQLKRSNPMPREARSECLST